jgi:hypothetical protein
MSARSSAFVFEVFDRRSRALEKFVDNAALVAAE